MYNFALAFTICAIFYIAGEWVDKLTHAWVPSVFVTAILMLLGYWFVLPYNLITDSVLLPFGATLGLFLLLVHMGTVLRPETAHDAMADHRHLPGWSGLGCVQPAGSCALCSWTGPS